MQVGILTFHRASNFGTMLQALASVKAIEKLGVNVELVDYRPEYIEKTIRKSDLSTAKSIKQLASLVVNRLIYGNASVEKINSFMRFYEHMNVSNIPCVSIDQLSSVTQQYDIIISGSDQLWNENITGADMAYFLPFPHKKKISFASSFGTSIISEKRQNEILPYILDFDGITVRENTAKCMLERIMSAKVNSIIDVVVDPTLLLSKQEWMRYSTHKLDLPSDGYILTYYMIETPMLRRITDKLRRETGLPVVNIKPSKKQMLFREGINLPGLGPAEFLECYSKARYVVTNSFHGTAFAVNFGIPLFVSSLPVSMAGEVNSRLIDLLEILGLSDRWIDHDEAVSNIDVKQSIEIKARLDELRTKTMNLLRNMIFQEGV